MLWIMIFVIKFQDLLNIILVYFRSEKAVLCTPKVPAAELPIAYSAEWDRMQDHRPCWEHDCGTKETEEYVHFFWEKLFVSKIHSIMTFNIFPWEELTVVRKNLFSMKCIMISSHFDMRNLKKVSICLFLSLHLKMLCLNVTTNVLLIHNACRNVVDNTSNLV